jgi:alkyl hydroperoxide reductase subunit AhpF
MKRRRSNRMTTREHERIHDVTLNRNVQPGSITWQANCLCGEEFEERSSETEAIVDLEAHLIEIEMMPRRQTP